MNNNNYTISIIHYTFALVLFLLPATLMAQLRVDDFSERVYDTTANAPETRKTDQNGDYCALIKVFAPPVNIDQFYFDGGALGIKAKEQHGSEIWIYVPASAQRVTISHPQFNRMVFEYTEPLKKGSTYQLLLNVGGGRFVTINADGAEKARITVNNSFLGETPVFSHYMSFGTYKITAEKGFLEGSMSLTVSEGEGTQFVTVPMKDQSSHYGDVTVSVDDPHADIFFQQQRQGAGRWQTKLKEGTYEVITRKVDCEDAVTQFTVKAQQQNAVKANAPVPHTGSVQLYVRPRNVQATYDNNQPIDLTEARVLPVGKHQFLFTRSGYETKRLELDVRRDELTRDTIQLEAINYLKSKWAFYFGAGYTLQGLSGLTGYVGAVYQHVDLQLSYTLGLSSSKDVYNYNKEYELLSGNTYKMNAFAARLGYQLRLIPRLGITPQVGFMQQMLTSTVSRGTGKYADGAKASCLTLGAKILAVPAHRVYLFLTPEYALEMSKDATFGKVSQAADFQAGGFSISAGVLINIGK